MSADAADPSSTLLGIASTTMIPFEDDTIQIPAAIIAHGLNLEIPTFQSLMRSGEVTSRCERGENEDAGRYRLTFFHKGRRVQLVIDSMGKILQRSAIDFGE